MTASVGGRSTTCVKKLSFVLALLAACDEEGGPIDVASSSSGEVGSSSESGESSSSESSESDGGSSSTGEVEDLYVEIRTHYACYDHVSITLAVVGGPSASRECPVPNVSHDEGDLSLKIKNGPGAWAVTVRYEGVDTRTIACTIDVTDEALANHDVFACP